ncbi:MAG: hypothetical protein K0R54_5736 [Clostridiaceae bacterium]|nr:hypothetical protein [Clostridiaceae bacterium]
MYTYSTIGLDTYPLDLNISYVEVNLACIRGIQMYMRFKYISC